MSRLTLDGHGRLPLPAPLARAFGSEPLELVSHSPRHLLLTVPGAAGPVVFAGRLGEIAVADLLSFLHMFRKSGELALELPGGEKHLFLSAGDLAFATSTFPEDELGEVLLGLGRIDRDVLQQARRLVTAGASLGKILVEKGALSPQELQAATRQQVEAIVYGLFACARGSFFFVARELEREDVPCLALSTQNLMMEGLRRLDERALYMRRIPSLDARPQLTADAGEGTTAPEQRLLALVRAAAGSVRELQRKSGLTEFEALRLLHQLIERGWVRLEAAPSVAVEGELGEILGICNGALSAVSRRLAERCPTFQQELRLFLRDLPQPFALVFRDVVLGPDGTLEGGRLLANLGALAEGERKALLVDALNELLFMACLAARRELGGEEAAELTRRVQEITRRLKTLAGRSE
jgi:hypothetical protein